MVNDHEQWLGPTSTSHLPDCDSIGRRYQNFYNNIISTDRRGQTLPPGGSMTRETQVSNLCLQTCTNNPHSDMPFTQQSSTPRAAKNNNSCCRRMHHKMEDIHYQVPQQHYARSLSATPYNNNCNSVNQLTSSNQYIGPLNEELNQLIETKRKRTLMLLMAKEAPRACIEPTSQADEPTLPTAPPASSSSSSESSEIDHLPPSVSVNDLTHSAGTRIMSPIASDYDNLSHHISQQQQQQEKFVDMDTSTPLGGDKLGQDHHQDGGLVSPDKLSNIEHEDEIVVSPSESQNFNTLSLVSDILGDYSQEDNSLVQQLSHEDQKDEGENYTSRSAR